MESLPLPRSNSPAQKTRLGSRDKFIRSLVSPTYLSWGRNKWTGVCALLSDKAESLDNLQRKTVIVFRIVIV